MSFKIFEKILKSIKKEVPMITSLSNYSNAPGITEQEAGERETVEAGKSLKITHSKEM